MASTTSNVYRSVLSQIDDQFERDLALGRLHPFLIPWDILNYVVLVTWLVATPNHTKLPRGCKYVVFGLVVFFSYRTIERCRSPGLADGVLIGVSSAWCVILAVNFVLIHDLSSFQRIVLQKQPRTASATDNKRSTTIPPNQRKSINSTQDEAASIDQGRLAWEGMPPSVWSRCGWVLDLISTLRGSHWSWSPRDRRPVNEIPEQASYERSSRLWTLIKLLFVYMVIDVLKIVVIEDPYFLTVRQTQPPSHLPVLLQQPLLLAMYRYLISLLCLYGGIFLLFNIFPILCVDILGPEVVGLYGEPWIYPPTYGSHTAVLEKGLRGFWGVWWHQMFRQHFTSIGNAVVALLPVKMTAQSQHMLRITVGFLLSGALHACGSYTLWGHTRPWGSFAFFALQPLGIYLQTAIMRPLTARIGKGAIFQLLNVVTTLLWLYLTFGPLSDDFAGGGMWLIEPLPISPLRGMGVGADGGHWWCLSGQWLRWHQGPTLWSSGTLL